MNPLIAVKEEEQEKIIKSRSLNTKLNKIDVYPFIAVLYNYCALWTSLNIFSFQ